MLTTWSHGRDWEMVRSIALPGLAQSDLYQASLYGEGGTGLSSEAAQTLLLQIGSALTRSFWFRVQVIESSVLWGFHRGALI